MITSLRHPKSVSEDAEILQRAVARLWLSRRRLRLGRLRRRRGAPPRLAVPPIPSSAPPYWVRSGTGEGAHRPPQAGREGLDLRAGLETGGEGRRAGIRTGRGRRASGCCLLDSADSEADLGSLLADRLAARRPVGRPRLCRRPLRPPRRRRLHRGARPRRRLSRSCSPSCRRAGPRRPSLGAAGRHRPVTDRSPRRSRPGFYSLLFLAQALGQRDPRGAGVAADGDPRPALRHRRRARGVNRHAGLRVRRHSAARAAQRALQRPPICRRGARRRTPSSRSSPEAEHGADAWVALRHGQRYVRHFELVPAAAAAPAPGEASQPTAERPERAAASDRGPSPVRPSPTPTSRPRASSSCRSPPSGRRCWASTAWVGTTTSSSWEATPWPACSWWAASRRGCRWESPRSASTKRRPSAAMGRLVGAESQADPDAAAPRLRGQPQPRRAAQGQAAPEGPQRRLGCVIRRPETTNAASSQARVRWLAAKLLPVRPVCSDAAPNRGAC